MFATMRRKRRSAKLKNELGQSVDHFKRAATIAAQETSSTVGPKLNAARDRVQPAVSQARDAASSGWGSAVATITPLATAVADNVLQAKRETAKTGRKQAKVSKKKARKLEKRANKVLGRQQSSGRKSKLFGIALIGAAVGVGAAYVLRRRQQAQWDEYDPSPVTTEPEGADDAAFEPLPPASETAPSTIADNPTVARQKL
ncbi:hypothetical protein [Actinoplanes sp. NPDC089786]|uniref:hypothetical protein n=1 Tax=Actinoplanes sp. NPDC089786 TaxID=3155185 RepID=UPI0034359674